MTTSEKEINETPVEETAEKVEETKKETKSAPKKEKKPKVSDKTKKLEEELANTKDTLLRTAAEYDNFRKRSAKEKEASFGNGVTNAVTSILPIIDTLEMAAKAPCSDENYKKGILMTLEKCAMAFNNMGITEIEAEGKEFNPELHSAVMQQSVEGVESGVVTQVLQKGYLLRDKVIRHASVAVAE